MMTPCQTGKGGTRRGLTARKHGRADYANHADREAKQELSSIVSVRLFLPADLKVRRYFLNNGCT